MSKNGLKIIGSKRLKNIFDDLEPRVRKKIGRKALREVSKQELALAKSFVPVDEGRLKKSLKSRGEKKRKGRKYKFTIGQVVRTGTREELGISPDDPNYYPLTVEVGSPKRNIKPHSYLRRASDIIQSVFITKLNSALRSGIIAEAKKIK